MSADGPRESIGLEAAMDGNPDGIRRFLDWVHRELYAIAYMGSSPKEISERIGDLARHTERMREFMDGFIAGTTKS